MSVAAITKRPSILSVQADGIPEPLLRDARWVGWRLDPKPKKPGEWTKVPYRADDPRLGASSTNSKTWATFDAAYMAYQSDPSIDGVGWNLEGSGVVGIDLDGVTDDAGQIAHPWVREIVDAFPGYWERSPSGRGLRGLARGVLPPGSRKGKYQGCTVEMYDGGRYLTITGHTVRPVDGNELPELQANIEAVHARLLPGGGAGSAELVDTRLTGRVAAVPPEGLDILARTFRDRFGDAFGRLWSGDMSDHTDDDGEVDESGADWRMARELIYQTRGDVELTELLMRASALYREKWDEPRPITKDNVTVRTTYLGLTIGNALGRWKTRQERVPVLALVPDAKTADETPEQTIARLMRELAQERAVAAVRASALRYERERANELDRRAKDTRDILRNPALSPTDKVVFMTIAWRVESGVSRGQEETKIVYPEVAEAAGVSAATVGRTLKRCAADAAAPETNADAPVVKRTVTEWREIEGQGMLPTSTVYLRPRGEGSILAAAAAYRPPEERKHGGARLPRCAVHPTADLVIRSTTHCASCGEQLGEPTESLRRQVASVGDSASGSSVEVRNPKGQQVASVGPRARLGGHLATVGPRLVLTPDEERRAREAVGVKTRDPDRWKQPEPEPVSLGPLVVKPKPWRCACGSLESGPRSDGTLVCDGCSAPVGTVRELADGVVETVRAGEMTIGRDPSLPPVDKDVTGYRPCCGEGVIHQRGGIWTCADCRAEVTA